MRRAAILLLFALPAFAAEPSKFTLAQSGATADPLTVLGPALACADNQVARFDGASATQLQCSVLTVADTTGNLTGPSGGFSIIGGTGASDTLTLDGSLGTAGSVTVSAAGGLTPTGGINLRTDQVVANEAVLMVGTVGTVHFFACNGLCSGTGSHATVVIASSDLQIYTLGNGITWEGTDDGYETRLVAVDTTGSDKVVTVPNKTGTVALEGQAAVTVVTASGDYNVAATDHVVIINKTVGAATAVNLPAGSLGLVVVVKDGKGDANANNITVAPAAGTIDGAASIVISTAYGSAAFIYNGTQWNVF